MDEETQYLYYGDLLVELLALMQKMADDVQRYVNSKPWTNNRKQRFLTAYSDMINRGLKGASNTTGKWRVEFGGEPFDINTLDRRDLEAYLEAAYFIRRLMSRLSSTSKSDDDKTKDLEDLILFDGEQFNKEFKRYFNKGFDIIIGGENDLWDYLDPRDPETGLRSRKNRANKLADLLLSYSDSLDGSKYTFEGSQFKNIEDFKERIANTVRALRETPENFNDDNDTLRALGLDPSIWFNNGSGDTYVDENGNSFKDANGNWITYGAFYNQKQKEAAAEAKKKLEEEEKKLKALENLKIYTSKPIKTNYDLNTLSKKYNNSSDNFIKYYNGKSFLSLTQDENDELLSFYREIDKNNLLDEIDDNDWELLNSKFQLLDSDKSRFKKLSGITNTYYDSINKNLFLFLDGTLLNTPSTNLFSGYTELDENLRLLKIVEQNMNTPIDWNSLLDWDNLDETTKNELTAVALDAAAFINPWAITGTASALGAAYFRDKNRDGSWNLERIADWGLSAAGGLPIIGDTLSVYKAAKGLVRAVNASARVAGILGTAFSVMNMPEAYDSIIKVGTQGFSSMTPLDIRNITYGLLGLASMYKTIGATNARPKESMTKELSIEVKGKDGKVEKIPLTEEVSEKVAEEYKSGKNNKEASEKVLNMLEVREAALRAGVELTPESKISGGAGWARGSSVGRAFGKSFIGKRVAPVPSPVLTRTNYTGEYSDLERLPYFRRAFFEGDHTSIGNIIRKPVDWFLGRETRNNNTVTSLETSTPTRTKGYTPSKKWNFEADTKEFRDILKGTAKHSGNAVQTGEFKIGNATFDIDVSTLGTYDGFINIMLNGRQLALKFANQKELSQLAAKFILLYKKEIFGPNKVDAKKIGEVLRLLKSKGVFKQGGKITDNQLDKFLKSYKI